MKNVHIHGEIIRNKLEIGDINNYIKSSQLRLFVKTSESETKLDGYDVTHDALILKVKSPPIEGKANIEIIKFFTKLLKKKVTIISGKTSSKKILKISD